MKTLEYVISAVAQGAFPNNKQLSDYHNDLIKEGLTNIVDITKKDVKENCKKYNAETSALFNAFTEEQYLSYFKYLDEMHMDKTYADSGGLQIVTAGKEMTAEIKDEIYKIQTFSDYAMCFDVIPLIRVSEKRTRNERSNVGNKIFKSEDLKECGIATGLNIKRQIEIFRNLNAKTKVIIIVQGNNYYDMVEFYKNIQEQLTDDDFEYVGGLAVADTCIGNGELESIEMLRAAHNISKIAHKNVTKHLHILGVGSIMRMKPVIYLLRSKYLDNFERISYDSSSHTSTFTYGLLKLNGTCKPLGTHRSYISEKHFSDVYTLYSNYLKNFVTEEKFLDTILGQKNEKIDFGVMGDDWKHSSIKKRSFENEKEETIVIAHLAKAFHTFYQINNFQKCLDDLWGDDFTGGPISSLLNCKDENDMNYWSKDWYGYVKSKKIKRQENLKNSLEALL